jgi:hypothetical protein
MPQFMLMLRDSGSFPETISAEEIQQIIERYRTWSERVGAKGQKLRDGEGRTLVRRDGGVTVTDGPYAESREVIGGYFVVDAPDYDAATKLVEDCPHLDFGSIEIRQIEF